ncbi:PhaM family polyhydroxyalkanoate granule multifunctional regulatory protein [Ottowia testudinis]|uniref:PhaM family polyhydroxyalkanoate granule multifunctional regulatory protein n=1 Tax=Ottowia testudinis TaxID=2816950 RepID=UPI003267DF20
MSDTNPFAFGNGIPGFDFLGHLAGGGKGALAGLANWVTPTVSIEELDKRIKDLKAVLFWLEQNGTALKATIQALEVQKMTLAALASMNLNMAEVAKAFTLPTQGEPDAPADTDAPAAGSPQDWPFASAPAPQAAEKPAPAAPPPDPRRAWPTPCNGGAR